MLKTIEMDQLIVLEGKQPLKYLNRIVCFKLRVAGREHYSVRRRIQWPLTVKFDTATQPFSKIDMQHGAYQHNTNINQKDMGYYLIRHATLDHFKIDMEIRKKCQWILTFLKFDTQH